MTGRWDTTVACALVISAAINVYLLVHRSAAPLRVSKGAMTGAGGSVDSPVPPRRPIGLLPEDIDQALPCEEQLAEVQARLAATQPELAKRLTPKDRFEAGTADPAAESEIKVLLETMFADAPDGFGYEAECRSGICSVTVDRGRTNYPWPERVQDQEFRSRWSSMMFEASTAYLELRAPR